MWQYGITEDPESPRGAPCTDFMKDCVTTGNFLNLTEPHFTLV